MRTLLLAFVLLCSPARADCYPAKDLVRLLTENGWAMVATYEKDHKPYAIFVNGDEWAEVVLDGKLLCDTAHGRAWHFVPERGA